MSIQTEVDPTVEAAPEPGSRSSKVGGRLGLLAFALLAYVPLFLTDAGKIDADSKAYLYLDPGRLVTGAASLWDPFIGMGTVAYQMVGFLFPVGPFYWVSEQVLGIAPWVAQRIWLGTLILAAGFGTRYLLRTLGMRGPGIAVGMAAYAFSPYALQFSSHTSVLLPPWAGMPWMIAFAVLALRRPGWLYPALLAITVQLTGAVNASTLAFALLAPALWVPFAVVVVREVDWRRAFGAIWRSTLLIVLTSLWWAEALAIESGYGRDVLRFTEQSSTTTATLNPAEVLRGLGYWIFYYREGNGPVGGAAATLMRNPTVLFVSLLIPALALLAATCVRWTYRAYFVLLTLVGVTLAVGSSSLGGQSPIGSLFGSFARTSTAGFALRNSARAVPLVALGVAGLLAAGVSSLHQWLEARRRSRLGVVAVVAVLVLCLVNAPGVWGRSYYDPTLEWRSVPAYWQQAADSLQAGSHDTRVLALPGLAVRRSHVGDHGRSGRTRADDAAVHDHRADPVGLGRDREPPVGRRRAVAGRRTGPELAGRDRPPDGRGRRTARPRSPDGPVRPRSRRRTVELVLTAFAGWFRAGADLRHDAEPDERRRQCRAAAAADCAAACRSPRPASDRHRAREVGHRPAGRRRRRQRPREPREHRAARPATSGALLADVRRPARRSARPAGGRGVGRDRLEPQAALLGDLAHEELRRHRAGRRAAAREEPVRPAARRVPRRDVEVADGDDPARREVGAGDAGLSGVQPDGNASIARARRQHLHGLVGRRGRAVGGEGAAAHRLREADDDRRAEHQPAARRRQPGSLDHARPAHVRRRAPRGADARRVLTHAPRPDTALPRADVLEPRDPDRRHAPHQGNPVRRRRLPGGPHRRPSTRTRRRCTCRSSRACRSTSSRHSGRSRSNTR